MTRRERSHRAVADLIRARGMLATDNVQLAAKLVKDRRHGVRRFPEPHVEWALRREKFSCRCSPELAGWIGVTLPWKQRALVARLSELAELARAHVNTVSRALAELEAAGWIEIVPDGVEVAWGLKRLPTHYRATPKLRAAWAAAKRRRPRGDLVDHHGEPAPTEEPAPAIDHHGQDARARIGHNFGDLLSETNFRSEERVTDQGETPAPTASTEGPSASPPVADVPEKSAAVAPTPRDPSELERWLLERLRLRGCATATKVAKWSAARRDRGWSASERAAALAALEARGLITHVDEMAHGPMRRMWIAVEQVQTDAPACKRSTGAPTERRP